MKISPSERVLYSNNPIAEVVCQLRVSRAKELGNSDLDTFRAGLPSGLYPVETEEQPFEILFQVAGSDPATVPAAAPAPKIFHHSSEDAVWRISACSDFIALACTRYSSWNDFQPRMHAAVEAFARCYPAATPTRLGLRYKDVIEREPLGLGRVPWSELVKPFLLGPLLPGALSDTEVPADDEVGSFLQQSIIKLDDCMLLLQSSLLTSVDANRRAFLIDADFFIEGDLDQSMLRDAQVLHEALEQLHNNAGALFRRGITEKLHHALGPSSI